MSHEDLTVVTTRLPRDYTDITEFTRFFFYFFYEDSATRTTNYWRFDCTPDFQKFTESDFLVWYPVSSKKKIEDFIVLTHIVFVDYFTFRFLFPCIFNMFFWFPEK